MKRYSVINKLAVFMAALLLTLAVATSAMAKGAEEWEKTEGTYIWTQSAQYSNGSLSVKKTEEGDNEFLYEFKVMRGSEKEDSCYTYNTAGIFVVDENGVGEALCVVDDKEVTLTFTLKDKTISVKQKGAMPADVSGDYKFLEKYLAISEAGAVAIIESLPPVKTSLNNTNSPWRLEFANETVGGWFYDIRAFDKNNEMFARFLVAADMTAVYRNDEVKDPILIYGSPATMLTTKTAPLLDEDEEGEEEPAPDAISEEEGDGEKEPAKDPSELSAVVSVGPADPVIKVGNKSKLAVSVPGNLHYKLSGLKSSAGDKVSVDDKGNLTAKAEGTATITGKLTVDDASRDFKVDVTAYVPKLECAMLPAQLNIKEKLKLEAYITEAGPVKVQWSVSDSKIAEIKNGVLIGKADGLVDVTAKTDKMTRTWKVAVGKAELPKEKVEEKSSFSPVTLAVPVVLIGGGAWWFMNRRKK